MRNHNQNAADNKAGQSDIYKNDFIFMDKYVEDDGDDAE